MSGNRPLVEPTRWDGVTHEQMYRDLVREPAAGAVRNTTESLRITASSLETNHSLLLEAVQVLRRALDQITSAGSGEAADARARAVAGLLVWLRELVAGAAALPAVITGIADQFDNASRKMPPPEQRTRRDDTDRPLAWIYGQSAEDNEAVAARSQAVARDQMIEYESEAGALLLGLPGFVAPTPELAPSAAPVAEQEPTVPLLRPSPDPTAHPASIDRPASAAPVAFPAESTVPLWRATLTAAMAEPRTGDFGPTGHTERDPSPAGDEAGTEAGRSPAATGASPPPAHCDEATAAVMRNWTGHSYFEDDQLLAPPVIGDEPDPRFGPRRGTDGR
ncbi:MAG: hypothetical protein ACRDQ5_08190 [Sciscionella sp.]